jgi:hypothetical protein
MKKLIFIIIICASFMISEKTTAQFGIRVNISNQPMWGPEGYDYVEYYYMPDIQVYYNVQRHRYVYMEHNHWVSRSYLPQRHRNYDVYNARKVVINEPKPYLHHHNNHQRYSGSSEYSNQKSIRDSRDVKYYQNKRHPEHKQWMNDKRNKGNNYNQYHKQEQKDKQNRKPDRNSRRNHK